MFDVSSPRVEVDVWPCKCACSESLLPLSNFWGCPREPGVFYSLTHVQDCIFPVHVSGAFCLL